MQSADNADNLQFNEWDVCIIGDVIDFRGLTTTDFARNNSNLCISALYDPTTLQISSKFENGNLLESIDELFASDDIEHVLLEATTLGFVEVFLLSKAAQTAGLKSISILYAEPHRYSSPTTGQVLRKRDFELSDEVENFTGVPGAGVMLRNANSSKIAFLVGYEGQRLAQALEQINVKPSECLVVFGVPAFRAGWEMNSFANNVRVLREREIGEVKFAGAHNPASVYEVLEQIHSSCTTGQQLLVSPIGTKPQGIGAALFACHHTGVGLLYDHPTRRADRTTSIATWHLFDAPL